MGRQMLSLTGPCLRLTQPLLALITRLKRLFFLSEGADLSRCGVAACKALGSVVPTPLCAASNVQARLDSSTMSVGRLSLLSCPEAMLLCCEPPEVNGGELRALHTQVPGDRPGDQPLPAVQHPAHHARLPRSCDATGVRGGPAACHSSGRCLGGAPCLDRRISRPTSCCWAKQRFLHLAVLVAHRKAGSSGNTRPDC